MAKLLSLLLLLALVHAVFTINRCSPEVKKGTWCAIDIKNARAGQTIEWIEMGNSGGNETMIVSCNNTQCSIHDVVRCNVTKLNSGFKCRLEVLMKPGAYYQKKNTTWQRRILGPQDETKIENMFSYVFSIKCSSEVEEGMWCDLDTKTVDKGQTIEWIEMDNSGGNETMIVSCNNTQCSIHDVARYNVTKLKVDSNKTFRCRLEVLMKSRADYENTTWQRRVLGLQGELRKNMFSYAQRKNIADSSNSNERDNSNDNDDNNSYSKISTTTTTSTTTTSTTTTSTTITITTASKNEVEKEQTSGSGGEGDNGKENATSSSPVVVFYVIGGIGGLVIVTLVSLLVAYKTGMLSKAKREKREIETIDSNFTERHVHVENDVYGMTISPDVVDIKNEIYGKVPASDVVDVKNEIYGKVPASDVVNDSC